MSSLIKIVKSIAVVEHPEKKLSASSKTEVDPGGILKRGMVEHGLPRKPHFIPNKDALADEVNRLRVEIKLAKEELKALGVELETARKLAEEEVRLEEEQVLAEEELTRQGKNLAEQAREQAAETIAQAQAERENILKEAEAEGILLSERAKNEGYLEGFSKGFEEATEEFKRDNTPKAVLIADMLDALREFRDEAIRESEEDLVRLAMAVASKVLSRTLETDSGAVADMLRGIVEENRREAYIKITLSPDISQIKAKAGKDVRSLLEKLGANITVVTDNDARQGSIFAETPKGVVDVSIQTQLDNLMSAIREEI